MKDNHLKHHMCTKLFAGKMNAALFDFFTTIPNIANSILAVGGWHLCWSNSLEELNISQRTKWAAVRHLCNTIQHRKYIYRLFMRSMIDIARNIWMFLLILTNVRITLWQRSLPRFKYLAWIAESVKKHGWMWYIHFDLASLSLWRYASTRIWLEYITSGMATCQGFGIRFFFQTYMIIQCGGLTMKYVHEFAVLVQMRQRFEYLFCIVIMIHIWKPDFQDLEITRGSCSPLAHT